MEPVKPASPAITSKNLPPQQPVVDKELSYGEIEAKPLRAPNLVNLVPRQPNMSLYFGNRAVGERESGMRYDQLIAMGFVPAKPDQVWMRNDGKLLPIPPSMVRDGRIMQGDVILLIMPKADYVGALKWNEQSARQRVKKPGVAITGDTQKSDSRLQPGNAGIPNHPLISSFVPNLAEVDSKTADNSGPEVNLAEK
jgi:hypothetical protein